MAETKDTPLFVETIQAKTRFMKKLRPVAIMTVLLSAFFYKYILNIPLPGLPLIIIAGVMLGYNAFFIVLEKRQDFSSSFWPRLFSTIRVGADQAMLGCLFYFSQGDWSPFYYFVFFNLVAYSIANSSQTLGLFMAFWAGLCYTLVFILPLLGLINPSPELVPVLSWQMATAHLIMIAESLFLIILEITFIVRLLEEREAVSAQVKADFQAASTELKQKIAEDETANKAMLDRELKMVKLKNLINERLTSFGRESKYKT
ncbi:MAG: hypothetical protein PHH14_03350 [Candidatus Margulisbacteria bacterium]|nr:hypothetical protein [Candidatus Margulisiibacteriota bacterium]